MNEKVLQPKVLLVNYEKDTLFELDKELSDGGFIVKKTLWGEAAVVLAKEDFFKIVYCSLNMPGMNGIEVSKKIAEVSPDSKVVLFVINHDQGEDREIMFWQPSDEDKLFDESCLIRNFASYTRKLLGFTDQMQA